LISDLSASDGNDGDLEVKLAALQDKNRANATSVDNSPYAEHYSDMISRSSDSSVLDLQASSDSLSAANDTFRNPLFSGQDKQEILEIPSASQIPTNASIHSVIPKTNVATFSDKAITEKNALSMQSVSNQLKIANDLAQKMMSKRAIPQSIPGGINRMPAKTSSIENLHSIRASVISSNEPVMIFNEFESYKKNATETIAKLEKKLADEHIIKQRLKIIQLENEELEKQNSKLTEENKQFKIKLLDAENSAATLKTSIEAHKTELDGLKKNAGDLGFVRQEAKKRSSTPPGALQLTPPIVNALSPSSPLKVSKH
jgi:hypothetical protein